MDQNYREATFVKTDRRFQMDIDGHTAFIDYAEPDGDLALLHTEVPEALKGRGVAAGLVERTLEYAEQHGRKIVPRCTYVISFLKRHPEWNRVVK